MTTRPRLSGRRGIRSGIRPAVGSGSRFDARYDVVIVGARAAGAATALLLARRGVRVLAVDRGRYGTDTLSTHALLRGGVIQLHRWGLLDGVRASGAPPVARTVFDYGEAERAVIEIEPLAGIDALFAPRRTVLDRLLVDSARRAGAEVRFGVAVEDLLRDAAGRVCGVVGRDRDGRALSARARLTIGADGVRSAVARAAGAPLTHRGRSAGAMIFGYFRGVEAEGYEWFYRPGAFAGLIPTNGGELCVLAGTTPERFRAEVQGDLDGGFQRILAAAAPRVAPAVAAARRSGRLRGFPGMPGFLRRPWGPGWALVGDASHFKDPLSAHGLTDALRDAELLARAAVAALARPVAETEAFEGYQRLRDRLSLPLHQAVERIARYDWTGAEIRDHLKALSRAMKAEVDLLLELDDRPAAA